MHYSKSKTKEILFPLGGIGTGSVCIGGNGRFQDFEIFNRPNKGSYNGYSHIAVKAEWDKKVATRILQGDLETNLMGTYSQTRYTGYGYGPSDSTMAGFPHFSKHTFSSNFPFAKLDFEDENFPCKMQLETFNPFIPGCSKDSSLPLAFFNVTFKNTTDYEMDVSAALSILNPYEKTKNVHSKLGHYDMVTLYSDEEVNTPKEGNITILAEGQTTGAQEYWYRGTWRDGISTFWHQFSNGDLSERHYDSANTKDSATVFAKAHVKAHGKVSVRFILSWYNPIFENYWSSDRDENGNRYKWRNYYATIFKSSIDVIKYGKRHYTSLRKLSKKFASSFSKSTLPKEIIEAATSNLCVLKSPTVLRLEDGTFWGWEGVHEKEGSCQGTCTHVWNYAYALCFLFPDLERSIREADFKYNQYDSGKMRFRLPLPMRKVDEDAMACVDGQMGGIIKTYREWKLSGDTNWLISIWPSVKKSLDYATSKENEYHWDMDCDGVLEGRQHHTLDMELFGPSSFLEGFYLAALKAGSIMAKAVHDDDASKRFDDLFKKGSIYTETNLFNGTYYIQKIDLQNEDLLKPFGKEVHDTYWNSESGQIKYQIENGSEIDQMVAQWHAHICGLGDIFNKEHRKKALEYMYKHNFKHSVRDMCNTWRNFSINDEPGAVICVYDDVNKPIIPIPYTEECMHGFEYAFAGLLIADGFVNEGLEVIRGVRYRYDGVKRNPFNEMECGSNYARSMASFALIPIYSGFYFDYTKNAIGFNPVENQKKFSTPFSVGGAFGTYEYNRTNAKISIITGTLTLKELNLNNSIKKINKITADGKLARFKIFNGIIYFDSPISIESNLLIFG